MKNSSTNKTIRTVVISVIIVYLIVFSIVGYFVVDVLIEIFKPYENGLEINSDEDFVNLNLPGTGTDEDPYIIANYCFSEKFIGILVKNTTKHFIITNCTMTGFHMGIVIESVQYGTCLISNNYMIDGWWPEVGPYTGVQINASDGVVITGNNIRSTGLEGIFLLSSNNCTLEENVISFCIDGISIKNCDNTNILSNFISDVSHHGICSLESAFTHISGNEIQDVTCEGIVLMESSFSTLSENILSYSEGQTSVRDGVTLYKSNNVTFVNNSITGYTQGLHLQNSDFCMIISNHFLNNSNFAIYLDSVSSSNIISLNSFVDNRSSENSQGFDDASEDANIWYNSTSMQGNYWNNWGGSGHYEISGNAGSFDIYPLLFPPSFVITFI